MTKYKKKADYEVGYGKPPRSGQVRPGQVLNPAGRKGKQGAQSRKDIAQRLAEELHAWTSRTVTVEKAGQPVKMSGLQVIIERLGQLAIKGDVRALKTFLGQVQSSPPLLSLVRPNGKVVFSFGPIDEEKLRDVSPTMILRVFPTMPDNDLAVIMRYWSLKDGETLHRPT